MRVVMHEPASGRLRARKREAPRADAPPRDEVAARSVDHCSFMTMRRNRWKSFAFFMALVNMKDREVELDLDQEVAYHVCVASRARRADVWRVYARIVNFQ